MASLTGVTWTTFGTIKREKVMKDAQFFTMPNPQSDSDSTWILDLFGVNKNINIDGTFVNGNGGLTIAQFIVQLQNLVNGDQNVATYTSDFYSAIKVRISSVEWYISEGEASSVNYTINLLECRNV